MQASVDLFIRSYKKDFEWLSYCLKSCAKSAKGFRQIHIVVPHGDQHELNHLTLEKVHICPRYTEDYLGQQVTKLNADLYSDADFICHIDSDTVWLHDVSPKDFIHKGKAIVYYEPYDRIGECPWQPIVEEAIGWKPEFEFMRRPPHTFPRWLYKEMRDFLQTTHKVPSDTFVATRPDRRFSEYNTLGAYAWKHHRDKFEWRDPKQDKDTVRQFWSWGGLEANRQELETILR
jgi:hypothetical protein